MELRQLRSLSALVEADFSVSRAAAQLHLVQPAVSQHLRQLEDELGARLLIRHGRRIVGLTPVGEQVLGHARSTLAGAANILAIAGEQGADDSGTLRVATTHTQARYVLPPIVRSYRARRPRVELQLHQAAPRDLVDLLRRDVAELAICTETIGSQSDLEASPCYRWNRCLVAPAGHPLLAARPITLELLCSQPIITYVIGFTGRGHFSDAFAREGLRPRVVISAADTDVVKTYVREGLGIGVIADIAYDPDADGDLGVRDLSHLFPAETTRIAHRREKYLRAFQRDFIELFQQQSAQVVRRQRRLATPLAEKPSAIR
jgi:LysR family cys regulon transcriptional activator